jgi:hypothetical protein
MGYRILALIFMPILLFGYEARCQSVYIPAFDPVNDDIITLIDRGYLQDIHITERPWMIGNVAKAILEEKTEFDFESYVLAESILDRLKAPQAKIPQRLFGGSKFGIDLRGLSRERKEGYFIYRGRYIERGFKGEIGSVYKAGGWLSRDGNWGIDTRLIFDSDGTGYPWYYGTAHNARIVGQFDRAYGFFELGFFDIMIGRNRMNWGPSPRGSLFLDDSSPPLDMFSAKFDLRPFRMSWFTAKLDDYPDLFSGLSVNRYLSGHRLSVKPSSNLELAASEIVLYGGVHRLPELYYSIPVVLFYWEAQNRKIDDNVIWAIDGSYIISDLGRVYLQFVADDIQYESNGPQKFAFQIGTSLVPARYPRWSGIFEVNFVDTFVYAQRQRRNAYLNWDVPIGRLDSDQFEIFAAVYRRIRHNIELGAEFIHREKGEFSAGDSYPDPLPKNEKFPSGIVEKTNDISVRISWNGLRNGYLNYSLGYQDIKNHDHRKGISFEQFYTYITLSYSIDLGLPLWTKYH